jgi:hypothetical protein
MVQLFDDHVWSSPRSNEYWKLDSGNRLRSYRLREELRDGNYSVLKSVNNTRLRALYIRCQRGLLSFEGMPSHELRLHAARRGLTVAPNATLTSIKAQLEQADDDATFDRFTDLPPEIRQIIFQYYMDDTLARRKPKSIYQPPLTMTSRMIRRETLPMFFDCWDTELSSLFTESPTLTPYKFRPSATTAQFLQSTPIHHLARLKSFILTFNDLKFRVAINLRNQDPIGKLEIFRMSYWEWELLENAVSQARVQRLLTALRTLALSMAARPGPLRFRLSDVDDIGETMRRIILDEDEKAGQ